MPGTKYCKCNGKQDVVPDCKGFQVQWEDGQRQHRIYGAMGNNGKQWKEPRNLSSNSVSHYSSSLRSGKPHSFSGLLINKTRIIFIFMVLFRFKSPLSKNNKIAATVLYHVPAILRGAIYLRYNFYGPAVLALVHHFPFVIVNWKEDSGLITFLLMVIPYFQEF